MEFNLWGTPDEAKDLSASVKKMLHKMLGVTEPSPRRELSEVRLSPIQLSDADLAELQGIVGAEYVLGWLPRGTHEWDRFLTPEELSEAIRLAGLDVFDLQGVTFHPLRDVWSLSRDTSVNYMLMAART